MAGWRGGGRHAQRLLQDRAADVVVAEERGHAELREDALEEGADVLVLPCGKVLPAPQRTFLMAFSCFQNVLAVFQGFFSVFMLLSGV